MHRKSRLVPLLKLLNELLKGMKCEACQEFFLLIRYKLNTYNNTGARLLGSICCLTRKLLLNHVKKLRGTML